VHGTKLLPRPAQDPGPPVWVGGIHGLARKRAALLGDGWYPIRITPDEVRSQLTEIHALREQNGFSNDGFTVTIGIPVHMGDDPLPPAFRAAIKGSPDEMAAQLGAYEDAGVDVFVIRSSSNEFERVREDMERFAEAMKVAA
jgi:alkanesulfonate monooxygenase SsuD/methylene tetrahydromethanopterin reductase-like flavin-dependent oxidoreductase (luciferase family)